MKQIELNASKLSIKNFCSLMESIDTTYTEEYEGAIAKIAPLCNVSIEDIEELDLTEVKSLAEQLKDLNLKDVIESKPQFEFDLDGIKYKVQTLADGSLNLKFNENKYLRSILKAENPSNKLFFDNLHKIAGVLFKPEDETKFVIETVEARAEIFKDKMPSEIIYPFIELIVNKLS